MNKRRRFIVMLRKNFRRRHAKTFQKPEIAPVRGCILKCDLGVLLVEQHIGFALQSAQRYHVVEAGRVTSSGSGGAAAESEVRAAMAI